MLGNGLPLYEFQYLDATTHYRGVMARMLQHTPAAVVMRADGYRAVDYGMPGLKMEPMR